VSLWRARSLLSEGTRTSPGFFCLPLLQGSKLGIHPSQLFGGHHAGCPLGVKLRQHLGMLMLPVSLPDGGRSCSSTLTLSDLGLQALEGGLRYDAGLTDALCLVAEILLGGVQGPQLVPGLGKGLCGRVSSLLVKIARAQSTSRAALI
jgi:hypothetical protein